MMETLDNNMQLPDPDGVPFINTAIRYGAIGGGVSIIYSLIAQLTGLAYPDGFGKIALLLVISIVITVFFTRLAIKYHRDEELGGYISFGRSFTVSIVAVVIMTIMGLVWTLIYSTYIDPEFGERMIDASISFMEDLGTPEELIEQQIAETKKQLTPAGLAKSTLMNGLIGGGIISLIMAAIMKKEIPLN